MLRTTRAPSRDTTVKGLTQTQTRNEKADELTHVHTYSLLLTYTHHILHSVHRDRATERHAGKRCSVMRCA